MPAADSTAFDLLDDRIQRWIWQRWSGLYDIQEGAIRAILEGGTDVLISAATASGKTEAAFLPICHRLAGDARGGVRALYVGPLKALINDQFGRLDALCESLEIPVSRWHGDVAAGAKQKALRHPAGILLITPESLEALFVRQGPRIGWIFSRLEFLVIDEVHSFIATERGRQLQSQISRLEGALGRPLRRIGLSATLGDIAVACDFLRPGGGERVEVLASTEFHQDVKLQIRGYRHVEPAAPETGEDEAGTGDQLDIARHLFETLRGGHNLVFANRRQEVEIFADLLRRRSDELRVPNEFWPHHGSLSKDLREDAEAFLKRPEQPATAICTSTLEMGIDIGLVAATAQIGPPPAVAGMRQRLGRSGRRQGDPAIMRLYVQEPEISPWTAPPDTLRPRLVQAIAMVHLLAARWIEPPVAGTLHLSTLVQQILSWLAQRGGAMASDAWQALCRAGPFREVGPSAFGRLLVALGSHELVAQMEDGTLIPGPEGERLINHYSFFAAFQTPVEFRLLHAGKTLGTMPVYDPLMGGAYLVFAGRRWKVLEVDAARKTVELEPSKGGRAPIFSGAAPWVHDRVRQEMRKVYQDEGMPAFLDAVARDLLAEGRQHFHRYGLADSSILKSGSDCLLFPFRGDRILNTLALMFLERGLAAQRDGMALAFQDVSPERLREHLGALAAADGTDPSALASLATNAESEKYHRYLPEDLLRADYASRALDVRGAVETAREIVG
ncbi:MAG: DEAD/DEAH box helicase [Candidatus Sericytochromatia bacterium]|nr:DEAD/DEAH box helicase [Candidatus Tanganyikabacteria bacterium]